MVSEAVVSEAVVSEAVVSEARRNTSATNGHWRREI
jgi:hypothetical protein